MTAPAPPPEIVAAFFAKAGMTGHNAALGIQFVTSGTDWAELVLPYRADLVGDVPSGVLASGPIVALLDMTSSIAVLLARGALEPTATLDLRVDYLRAARPGQTVTARCECYRMTRRIAFVRGVAHDGDPADPVAHVAGTFIFTDVA